MICTPSRVLCGRRAGTVPCLLTYNLSSVLLAHCFSRSRSVRPNPYMYLYIVPGNPRLSDEPFLIFFFVLDILTHTTTYLPYTSYTCRDA
ncbi:hypothetical protein F4801DRAFT_566578 [Xylaria longipes]|nr:hypothetical protein F4801DRAFT_566578 [Xylaria longipes]